MRMVGPGGRKPRVPKSEKSVLFVGIYLSPIAVADPRPVQRERHP